MSFAATARALRTCIFVAAALLAALCSHAPAEEEPVRPTLPTAAELKLLPADGGDRYNRLVFESSPYLLQHAANPVDWYPWGAEAFARAREEGKPVFLSVGYSTCHWCHVMEVESFEQPDVAAILNEKYIAIKVDREERPELDGIYITVTQMLNGSAGWPNSVWLTADGKPFFAGTYIPREQFKDMLTKLALRYAVDKPNIDDIANDLTATIAEYTEMAGTESDAPMSSKAVKSVVDAAMSDFDSTHGGSVGYPKFPPHGNLQFMTFAYRFGEQERAGKYLGTTLDRMAAGGIHDQLGGGFHRYSTDSKWLLPHFEKMLYDNAQLARSYVDGYVLLGKDSYRQTALNTYAWVLAEMQDPKGGFYSAIDADSEGEEGRFYVFSLQELKSVLGESAATAFAAAFGVTADGNYLDESSGQRTKANVLHLPRPLDQTAKELGTSTAALATELAESRQKLKAYRDKRIRPHLDDKVLTEWNGLMIGSLAYGGRHLDDPKLVDAAAKAAHFVLDNMRVDGRLQRSYRDGRANIAAFASDYTHLAYGLLELYLSTGDSYWLEEVGSLMDELAQHFSDPQGGGYYFAAGDDGQLIVRTKQVLDDVTPAANGMAALVLASLGALQGDSARLDAARRIINSYREEMASSPRSTVSLHLAEAQLATGQVVANIQSEFTPGLQLGSGDIPDISTAQGPVSVHGFASALRARPGADIDLALEVKVAEPFHINGNLAGGKDIVPTSLTLVKTDVAQLSRVNYPKPFEVLPGVQGFVGTVAIKGQLDISRDAKPGLHVLTLNLVTQPCDDKACQLPQTHVLALSVLVDTDADAAPPRHPQYFKRQGGSGKGLAGVVLVAVAGVAVLIVAMQRRKSLRRHAAGGG